MPSLPRRALCKTLCYKGIMVVVHFLVGFLFTGSWEFGSLLAAVDLVLGLILYYYHERMWSRYISFGKVQ